MNATSLFAVIALAALIHASFQLSVSMLTLVSGHALGTKARHRRVMNLGSSLTLGAMTMTTLLLCSLAYLAGVFFSRYNHTLVWSIITGVMAAVGLAVWIFYYRKADGTALWLPQSLTTTLRGRIKETHFGAEAFSLGLTGVLAELVFIIAPIGAAAFALVHLPSYMQIVGVITYTLLASMPLLIVLLMIGGGHRISRIQKWREQNKRFLQFAAGSALFVLAFYIYATTVLEPLLLEKML